MKDNEEREQSNDITPNREVSPVKLTEKSLELDCQTEEPDSTAADSGTLDEKDPSGGDVAQGALGQVKAKVEVCKDESIGEDLSFYLFQVGHIPPTQVRHQCFFFSHPEILAVAWVH